MTGRKTFGDTGGRTSRRRVRAEFAERNSEPSCKSSDAPIARERERERERGEGGLVARNHADRLANEQNSPEQLRELLSRRFQLLFSFLLFVVVAFLRRS